MRGAMTLCLAVGLALNGGTAFAQNKPHGGGLLGAIGDLFRPSKEAQEALKAADDAKCQEFGFKLQTEGYANCRLKLEELRANQRAAATAAPRPQQPNSGSSSFMCKNAIANGDRGGIFIFC